MKTNMILIGFMGSGKTSVGKQLAYELGYSFFDTDQLIEQEQNMSIKELFTKYGEAHFRKIESGTIKDKIETLDNAVVSTGGGLAIQEGNDKLLRELGTVIFLRTTKDTVLNRLQYDVTRPLLAGEDRGTRVEELLMFRNPIYERVAHIIVDTDGKSPSQIAKEIRHKVAL